MSMFTKTLVASTLGNIGTDIQQSIQKNKERRNLLVNEQIKHMMEEGRTAFNNRKEQRRQVKDNIKYFETLGFNRRDIEKFVSLPQKRIEELQGYLDSGRKEAAMAEMPFDAAAHIKLDVDETGRGITGEEEIPKNEWIEETLGRVLGVIDPKKFKDAEEQKTFGDNFRENLALQFGSLGGTSEQALRETAMIMGKDTGELQAALDDDYVRADIDTPEYTIGYDQETRLKIQEAELMLQKTRLQLTQLKREESSGNTTLGELRAKEQDESVRATMFPLANGRFGPDSMTKRDYMDTLEMQIQQDQVRIASYNRSLIGQFQPGEQTRMRRAAMVTASNITGVELKIGAHGEALFGTGVPRATSIAEKASTASSQLRKYIPYTGDIGRLYSATRAASSNISLFLVYKDLQKIAKGENITDKTHNLTTLIEGKFETSGGTWSPTEADKSLVELIKKNKYTVDLLYQNINELKALDKASQYDKEIAINTIIEGVATNSETSTLPSYFTGMRDPQVKDEKQQTPSGTGGLETGEDIVDNISSFEQIDNERTKKLLSEGVFKITDRMKNDVALYTFLNQFGFDFGDLQTYLERTNNITPIDSGNLRHHIKLFVKNHKRDNS